MMSNRAAQLAISHFRTLLLWTTALCAFSGCAFPGTPRFTKKPPSALPLSPAPLSPRQVVLIHQPIGPFTFVSSGHTFRLAVNTAGSAPRENQEPLGEMRSTDERLSPPTYDKLRCGWCVPLTGLPDTACRGRNKARDRKITTPIVRSALADLRRQAAAGGVHVVAYVKCFAAQRHLKGKLWCEGLAMRSPPR